ncbi:hypothetical protein Tco_0462186 [Tanacetum coccineum]
MKSSSVSFDFTDKLLNFENVSPADNEIAFLMDTTVPHEEPSTTPTPTPTAPEVTTSFLALLDFSSVFRFNNGIATLPTNKEEPFNKPLCPILQNVEKKLLLTEGISEFATPVIERNVTESLEAAILAKYSSQIKSTYEAAASLFEFELMKILIDKIEEHKSYLIADYKRELYDALIKSYNTDKDLFDTYEEPSHIVDDSRVQHNQEFDTGNNDEQLDDEAASKNNWYKKPEQPSTPDPDWDKRQHVDFRPPQTWISNIACAGKPPTSFDELMDTPIDFSAFVMNRLNITNLTQELLIGPAFNLLKDTCKSRKQYPFDLRKPFPLILNHRGRHVIPFDYYINKDIEYLKGGSLSSKYLTSVTKTKYATFEVQWIEDTVPNIWCLVKVVYDKHAFWVTSHWVTSLKIIKWYEYGHLDEIEVHKEDQQLYTFKEDPQGVIYKDQNNINRLMHTDKLHKFSDSTLNYVQTALHDITSRIRMEYLPKRKWSGLDKRRARVMIQNIDKQLFQRRLMRNVEKFLVKESTKKTSDCLNGQYDFVIYCPTTFQIIFS